MTAAGSNTLFSSHAASVPGRDLGRAPWRECLNHSPFVFQQSDTAMREQTRVHVVHGDDFICFGIRCDLDQPAPEAGARGYEGEHIEIFIDPDNAQSSCIQFCINISGRTSAFDHGTPGSNTTETPWWCEWKAEVSSGATHWQARVTIPLPQAVDEGEIWGLNVFRHHANTSENSSWCSYSEGFNAPTEYGNLVFGSPADLELPRYRQRVAWPSATAARPLALHMTTDPPDDLSGWFLSPERLEGYFRFFAELGVTRLYWMDRGPNPNGYWDNVSTLDNNRSLQRSLAAFDDDFLPGAIDAAHTVGMELYCEVKPWDWGSCVVYPTGTDRPGHAGLDAVGGRTYPANEFVANPHWNAMRTPLGTADQKQQIREIVLMKDDDAPAPFAIDELKVWASPTNSDYREVHGFQVTEAVENRPILKKTFLGAEEMDERRPVRVVRIRNIRIDDRYVAIEIPSTKGAFKNRAFALARLFDDAGEEITASIGYLSHNRTGDSYNWYGRQEGWKRDGIYYEMSGATSSPGGFLAIWELDNPCGVIGMARGRNAFVSGAPEPADPEVADWIVGWASRAVQFGADGFEYRVRCHHVAMEWEAYGYSPAVQAAFRNAMGRALRLDGSDTEALSAFRGQCYADIMRRAKVVCQQAGIPFGLQVTPDLGANGTQSYHKGILYDWRTWINEGIADQITTKYVSPYSPIYREVHDLCKARDIPLYIEYERFFASKRSPEIYAHFFATAKDAGAEAVNLYESANIAYIDDQTGQTMSKHSRFTDFLTNQ
jgi:hypothetical protein